MGRIIHRPADVVHRANTAPDPRDAWLEAWIEGPFSAIPGGAAPYGRDAIEIETADGVQILVASLADVTRSKEAAGREKDRIALPRLRRLLDRTSDQEPGD